MIVRAIKRAIGLLILSQLGACAVMSKQECVNADWRQVGYQVGVDGNTDISQAYSARERACSKHGVEANWQHFEQGHADGVVQYCQLDNAVELGVRGASRSIDNQVCSERDYPGFREAFNVGYKLYALRKLVQESDSTIANLNSKTYRHQQDIRRINHDLESEDLDKSARKRLRQERRKIRAYIYELDQEIKQCNNRLYRQKSAARNYSDYVYQDYVFSLNDEFVDPRKPKPFVPKKKQNGFDDRIDEILNE